MMSEAAGAFSNYMVTGLNLEGVVQAFSFGFIQLRVSGSVRHRCVAGPLGTYPVLFRPWASF